MAHDINILSQRLLLISENRILIHRRKPLFISYCCDRILIREQVRFEASVASRLSQHCLYCPSSHQQKRDRKRQKFLELCSLLRNWKLLSGDFSDLSFPFLNNSRTKTTPHRVRSVRRAIRRWAGCFLPSPYLPRYSSQSPGDSCLLHTWRDTVLRVSLVSRNHEQSRWEHCSLVFRTSVTMVNV